MKEADAISLVVKELVRATNTYGAFNSAHEGYAVILEELDELWNEIKKKSAKRNQQILIDEAKQVAAMAIRFMVDIC